MAFGDFGEPRQPVRRAASAASRLSASSIGSEMTRHAPAKEGVLIDIDNDDAPRLPPLPLQMLGTGGSGSAGYGLGPTTEAQRYARAFDRRDAEDVGKRPLLSLLPLWLARKAGRSGSSRRP